MAYQSSEVMGRIFARVTFLPTLFYNLALHRAAMISWFSPIDSRVILGALPLRHMTKELVEKEKVRAVISMNEDYELKWLSNMHKDWESVGVKFLQLSTVDVFEAPCQEKLHSGVQFIENFDKKCQDGKVYVHCKAGRTRSATLVACYLMSKYKWSPEAAIEHMRTHRPHIWLGPRQHQAINQYYKKLLQD